MIMTPYQLATTAALSLESRPERGRYFHDRLLRSGLITQGKPGRGKRTPARPSDATNLVLALAAEPTHTEVADVIQEYRDLEPTGGNVVFRALGQAWQRPEEALGRAWCEEATANVAGSFPTFGDLLDAAFEHEGAFSAVSSGVVAHAVVTALAIDTAPSRVAEVHFAVIEGEADIDFRLHYGHAGQTLARRTVQISGEVVANILSGLERVSNDNASVS